MAVPTNDHLFRRLVQLHCCTYMSITTKHVHMNSVRKSPILYCRNQTVLHRELGNGFIRNTAAEIVFQHTQHCYSPAQHPSITFLLCLQLDPSSLPGPTKPCGLVSSPCKQGPCPCLPVPPPSTRLPTLHVSDTFPFNAQLQFISRKVLPLPVYLFTMS